MIEELGEDVDEALDLPQVAVRPERRRGVSGWLSAHRRPVVVVHRWLGIVLALWLVTRAGACAVLALGSPCPDAPTA